MPFDTPSPAMLYSAVNTSMSVILREAMAGTTAHNATSSRSVAHLNILDPGAVFITLAFRGPG